MKRINKNGGTVAKRPSNARESTCDTQIFERNYSRNFLATLFHPSPLSLSISLSLFLGRISSRLDST